MANALAATTLLDQPRPVQPPTKDTVAPPPSEDLPVQAAGQGEVEVVNPLAGLIRNVSREEYDGATPQRQGTASANGGKAADIIAFAKKFVGTPYRWGKSDPLSGFDCSGLTQYVFKHFGIDLPRVSYQQGQGGKAVSNNALQPGDLIFWDNSARNNGADHVAIYIGGGQIIAAPKPGDHVKIQALYGNYFARRYL